MDKTILLNKIKVHYKLKKDSDLARLLGISPQTLSNWKKRNSYDPQLIYSKCTEINSEWLLTGQGPMLKSDYLNKNQKLLKAREPENESIENIQEIPLYSLERDGGLKKFLSREPEKNPKNTIKIPDIAECNGATYVKGNSMLPLLKSGDIIAFKSVSMEDIFWGEMYLIETIIDKSSYLTIRYLHKSELGEDFIRLTSENPDHDSKDLPINKINAIALIRASIRLY